MDNQIQKALDIVQEEIDFLLKNSSQNLQKLLTPLIRAKVGLQEFLDLAEKRI